MSLFWKCLRAFAYACAMCCTSCTVSWAAIVVPKSECSVMCYLCCNFTSCTQSWWWWFLLLLFIAWLLKLSRMPNWVIQNLLFVCSLSVSPKEIFRRIRSVLNPKLIQSWTARRNLNAHCTEIFVHDGDGTKLTDRKRMRFVGYFFWDSSFFCNNCSGMKQNTYKSNEVDVSILVS